MWAPACTFALKRGTSFTTTKSFSGTLQLLLLLITIIVTVHHQNLW